MRLKNIFVLCKEAEPYIDRIGFTSREKYLEMNDWYTVKDYFYSLKNVNTLSEIIDKIDSASLDFSKQRSVKLTQEEYQIVSPAVTLLKSRVKAFSALGDSFGYAEVKNGFDIKLPPNIEFHEMITCLKDIQTAFSQCPYLNQEGDKIDYLNCDIGSTWLTFAAISTGALLLIERIAHIVDKCVKIRSHNLTCKQQVEQLRAMKAKNDLIENTIQIHKEMNKVFLGQCMDELKQEISELSSNEDNERVVLSINLLTSWMEKGLEIYATIDAPEEIKDLFPKENQQKLTANELKLLTPYTDTTE